MDKVYTQEEVTAIKEAVNTLNKAGLLYISDWLITYVDGSGFGCTREDIIKYRPLTVVEAANVLFAYEFDNPNKLDDNEQVWVSDSYIVGGLMYDELAPIKDKVLEDAKNAIGEIGGFSVRIEPKSEENPDFNKIFFVAYRTKQ